MKATGMSWPTSATTTDEPAAGQTTFYEAGRYSDKRQTPPSPMVSFLGTSAPYEAPSAPARSFYTFTTTTSACPLHPRQSAFLQPSYTMFSAARTYPRRVIVSRLIVRSLSTEPVTSSSSNPHLPPHLPPAHGHNTRSSSRSRLNPAPRPAVPRTRQALPSLPSSFGRNQILPVTDSTRALLESIVAQFQAPIRYAFAYGSGVFEQDGYPTGDPTSKDGPMLDFLFAVTHASHFHSINMHQYPGHYPLYTRMLGSDFVARVEDIGPGVWFNAFVPMKGVVSPLGRVPDAFLTLV